WQVYYPTNAPIAVNLMQIRRALDATIRHFDPGGTTRATQHMMLVGHSMGGVIARLLVSSSGDRLWSLVPEGSRLSAAKRARLHKALEPYLQFSPMPQVDEAVFLAAPHRGTPTARHRLARWVAELIRLPFSVLKEMTSISDLLKDDSGKGAPLHVSNSVDNLSDTDPFIVATENLPISPDVRYHSIIGLYKPHGELAQSSDGVVPYTSAHLAGAASEVVIPSWHSVQETPAAILELRRIMRLHLAREKERGGVALGLLERRALRARFRGGHAACLEVGERDVARIPQVVRRGGAQFLRIRLHALRQREREFAPLLHRGAERRDERRELRVARVRLAERTDLAGEMLEAHALQLQDFPAQQVGGLDTGGALVQRDDARVAHELLHAVLADVAVAAVHLQRLLGALLREFRHHALGDRDQEGDQLAGRLARGFVHAARLDVGLQRGVVQQRARAFHEGALGQQHAAHIGLHQQVVGHLVGELRAGQRAALQALARVVERVLVRALGQRETLHAHRQARGIHHGEHRGQALVRLADQETFRAVEVHHAGGRALDAHLVLDGAGERGVACTRRT